MLIYIIRVRFPFSYTVSSDQEVLDLLIGPPPPNTPAQPILRGFTDGSLFREHGIFAEGANVPDAVHVVMYIYYDDLTAGDR